MVTKNKRALKSVLWFCTTGPGVVGTCRYLVISEFISENH